MIYDRNRRRGISVQNNMYNDNIIVHGVHFIIIIIIIIMTLCFRFTVLL